MLNYTLSDKKIRFALIEHITLSGDPINNHFSQLNVLWQVFSTENVNIVNSCTVNKSTLT